MHGVANLLAGTLAFAGSHLLLSHLLRPPVVARIGERAFLILYAVVALATFGWFATAASMAPNAPVWWIAPPGVWDVATLVMLGASVLLVGSLIGNPAMVDPTLRPKIPDQPRGVQAITRHPMMWAFSIWAIVHAVLWGTPANLIVSAGLGGLAFFGSLGQDAKKARLLGQGWTEWRTKTSFWPFGAQFSGRLPWRSARPRAGVLIGSVVLWAVATAAHPWFGGPVAGPWRWLH